MFLCFIVKCSFVNVTFSVVKIKIKTTPATDSQYCDILWSSEHDEWQKMSSISWTAVNTYVRLLHIFFDLFFCFDDYKCWCFYQFSICPHT